VLLPVHIAVNVLGLAAFAIAFVVAVAYLIQEYQIKQKRLGGPFRRLPPLDLLDSVGVASVTIGFPLLTIGIVSGVVFARRLAEQTWSPSAQQTLAFVAWIVFAAVLVLRVAAGWRGRRAAIGTILGFASSVTVLVVYLVRTAPPV
jgi:ABC-type transport system involved in cytochrome c biogenesis permease subunit